MPFPPSCSCPARFGLPRRLPVVLLLFCVALCALLKPAPALAHRVNIFAWTEGSQVVVECSFNGGNKVKGGEITVFDAVDGRELLRGHSDGAGLFRFDAPPQGMVHGLRIRVDAGEGHQNQWLVEAAELAETSMPTANGAADSATTAAPFATPSAAPASSPAAKGLTSGRVNAGAAPVTPGQVQEIVNAALDAKLAPIKRELAQIRAAGPGLVEIIGGIGWLLGLAGIGLYFKGRRG